MDKHTEGKKAEVSGDIKKNVGKLTGNPNLTAEGAAQEQQGKDQQREAARQDEAVGAVQSRVGEVLGDEQMAAEGRERELKGQREKTTK